MLLAGVLLVTSLVVAHSAGAQVVATTKLEFSSFAYQANYTGGTYPPESAIPNEGEIIGGGDPLRLTRSLEGGSYRVSNVFVEWNTGALPDDAEVISAEVRVGVRSRTSGNNLGVTADWYLGDCCSLAGYTSTSQTGAIEPSDITDFECCDPQAAVANTIELVDPEQHISLTGRTGIRLHIATGVPSAVNRVDFSANPTLIVHFRKRQTVSAAGVSTRRPQFFTVASYARPDVLQAASARRSPFFNRQGAVADANAHWNTSRSTPFHRFGGTDCANFVSTAWHFGGGLNMTSGWHIYALRSWLTGNVSKDRTYTKSWPCARCFAFYMVNDRKIASFRTADPSKAFNPAQPGDAILYDWGRGQGWSHLAIEVGWDGSGDKIDQHSKDRLRSPWNLGYRNERNPQVRRKMKALVVHVNVP
ncbi:MAG: amidase domain-containing protein [Actinomycetota bacterium]|nr:amidase domain-containing protein [Actinomycetota bacterium]